MAAIGDRVERIPPHPLHAILLAFPVALFVGALVSDYAYWSSYQTQWANFAAWLNAGGLLVGALVLLWAVVAFLRVGRARRGRPTLYLLVLLAMWLLGFVNALIHGRDAWAMMPAGLILSAIVAILALVAGWIGYAGLPRREAR
jgi:uncharacterized membrane protein